MLLDNFFSEKLNDFPYGDTVKAYIISICKQYLKPDNDFSKQSLTLLYIKACENGDFSQFQSIADWSFWLAVFQAPAFIEHKILYEGIARTSYDRCHRILRGQWPIFEQLADEFPQITKLTREKIVVSTQLIIVN